MTGRSFFPLLTGDRYVPREYIFGARLHHGNAAFTPETRASTFDLSRCVRSQRFKLIYNVTPQMEYWPVDSGEDPGWQQILAAHQAGSLPREHERAYFQRPRPVLEFYDLEKDPAELNNVSGSPEYRDQQQTLTAALQEKMILRPRLRPACGRRGHAPQAAEQFALSSRPGYPPFSIRLIFARRRRWRSSFE